MKYYMVNGVAFLSYIAAFEYSKFVGKTLFARFESADQGKIDLIMQQARFLEDKEETAAQAKS